MNAALSYIVWNPNISFQIGPFGLRWYSLCWLLGLLFAYLIVRNLYRQEKIKQELFEPLFIYCFLGILIGARLGHCIFYQPDYFFSSGQHFLEMFLPIHFGNNGSWCGETFGFFWTGFQGLASHGGTIGLMIALWLYVRWSKLSIWKVLDFIAIATPVTACFIRLGNLMNSEIIGKVTDVPWAFIFEKVDTLPRHPGQLYEAIAYACFFVIGWYFYQKGKEASTKKQETIFLPGTGFFFGLCLTMIFTFRFFIEYTKDIQEAFEANMLLNMGQILSIPFIIAGIYCMMKAKKRINK